VDGRPDALGEIGSVVSTTSWVELVEACWTTGETTAAY
jgi:hypothetical protein